MCWTRETGLIPAALASLLLGLKAPGAQMIASVTFIAVLMTILIQAPTTKWLGSKLGLLEDGTNVPELICRAARGCSRIAYEV